MLFSQATETLLDSSTALWLAVAALAAITLMGSLSRRRAGLTDSLREFVSRQHRANRPEVVGGEAQPPAPDAPSPVPVKNPHDE